MFQKGTRNFKKGRLSAIRVEVRKSSKLESDWEAGIFLEREIVEIEHKKYVF